MFMFSRPLKVAAFVCMTLALLSTTKGHAQTNSFGFKTGVNFSTFRGDTNALVELIDVSSLQRRTSFQIGGFAVIGLTDRFALHPELLYIQKGAVLAGSNFGAGRLKGTYRFSYLQFPLLLEAQIPTGREIVPILFLGPFISARVTSGLEVEFPDNTERNSYNDVTSSVDIGGVIGAGVRYRLSDAQILTFDVRYNPGFSDVATEENLVLRTDSITLSFGLAFPL